MRAASPSNRRFLDARDGRPGQGGTRRGTKALGPAPPRRAIHYLIWVWLVLQLMYTPPAPSLPFHLNLVIDVTPDRIAFLIIGILFGWRLISDRQSLLPNTQIELMMALLSAIALVSLIASGANADTSHGENGWISSLFSFLIVPYVVYYVTKNLHYDDGILSQYLLVFSALGFYLGLTAIFEVCKYTSLVFPRHIMDPSVGIHFGRARGAVLNAGFLGQLLIFCFFMTLLNLQRSRKLAKALYATGGLVMLAGIYFTYTRGPWLALAAGLVVLLAARSKLRRYAFAYCCLILAVALLGVATKLSLDQPTLFSQREGTIYERINIMAATLRMISDKPLFGVGYGMFQKESPKYWKRVSDLPLSGRGEANHNVPLGLMAEVGLLGLICYAGIFYKLIERCLSLYSSLDESRQLTKGLALTYLACLAAYLVNMQTLDVRWNMSQNVMIFMIAGMVISLASSGLAQALPGSRIDRRVGRAHV